MKMLSISNEYINIYQGLLTKFKEELHFTNSGEEVGDKTQIFYFSIAFKTIHSLEGVLGLLEIIGKKPFVKIAVYSIIRDIISDLVLGEYLSIKEEVGEDFSKELEKIYSEHYIFTDRIKELNKKIFGKNEGYSNIEKEFLDQGEELRNENGKIKSEFKSKSLFKKLEFLFDKQSDKDIKIYYEDFYLWYFYTSKISHFGDLTINVIGISINPDIEREKGLDLKRLLETFLHFLFGNFERINSEFSTEKYLDEFSGLLKTPFYNIKQ